VGTAALELGRLAGLSLFGTASARDRAAVERLGAVHIDDRNEDFLARVRELTGGEGVDVVLDGIGGAVSPRSFRALRVGDQITGDPGGRLVMIGIYYTMVQGRKSWRGWLEGWLATAIVWVWGTLSSRRRVTGYRVQKLRIPHQDWFREARQLGGEGKARPRAISRRGRSLMTRDRALCSRGRVDFGLRSRRLLAACVVWRREDPWRALMP